MRIAGHWVIHTPKRAGEIADSLKELIEEFLDRFPTIELGHAGHKTCEGLYRKNISRIRDKSFELLQKSKSLRQSDEVHIEFKDGEARSFESISAHLRIFGENLLEIPSQNAHLLNTIQVIFSANICDADLESMSRWFEKVFRNVSGIYGYINPVVDYDMFVPSQETSQILDLLKTNLILDFYDDTNSMTSFFDRIKGPMWLTLVSSEHQGKLGSLPDGVGYSVRESDECIAVQLLGNPFLDPYETTYERYRELALKTEQISLKEFVPVMFRFPYKYPNNFAKFWIRRFITDEWVSIPFPRRRGEN